MARQHWRVHVIGREGGKGVVQFDCKPRIDTTNVDVGWFRSMASIHLAHGMGVSGVQRLDVSEDGGETWATVWPQSA